MNSAKSANNNYFTNNLEEDFNTIQEVVRTDTIKDSVPDVCGN